MSKADFVTLVGLRVPSGSPAGLFLLPPPPPPRGESLKVIIAFFLAKSIGLLFSTHLLWQKPQKKNFFGGGAGRTRHCFTLLIHVPTPPPFICNFSFSVPVFPNAKALHIWETTCSRSQSVSHSSFQVSPAEEMLPLSSIQQQEEEGLLQETFFSSPLSLSPNSIF